MTMLKNANNTTNFNFYTDPGHGWLAVKRDDLLNLGLTALAISPCSYQRGGTVYLEEDCDAGEFLTALKQAGKQYHITEKSSDRSSPIRNYSCFGLTEAELKTLKASTQASWQQVDLLPIENPITYANQGAGQ